MLCRVIIKPMLRAGTRERRVQKQVRQEYFENRTHGFEYLLNGGEHTNNEMRSNTIETAQRLVHCRLRAKQKSIPRPLRQLESHGSQCKMNENHQ